MELDNYSTREKKDAEVGFIKKEKFDPFTERKVENPTTDGETLTHLLKASLGTGILSMGCAFRSSGLALGIISTILIGFISTYCAYILVKCAHILYHKCHKTQMSYADIAEAALAVGPKPFRKFAKLLRVIVDLGLFCIYYGACVACTVIVAKNFKQILDFHEIHYNNEFIPLSWIIVVLLIPIILLTLIQDLKYLAPVSTIANGLMFGGLTIIFIWLVTELFGKDLIHQKGFNWIGIDENKSLSLSWYSKYSETFAITIFAMAAIGVVMPLENKMKTPKNFLGPVGILSKGMIFVTIIYMIAGILAYLKDPIATTDVITLEMPMDGTFLTSFMAQAARILISLSVFSSYCLCLFVCLEIIWNLIKNNFTDNPKRANYILKLILAVASVMLAFFFPNVIAILGIIGAFFLSILGLLVPVIIETITYWEDDNHRVLRALKNIVIAIVALNALYFGALA
ncbi:proton-coupled amino acid transporter-like protein pathetic [Aphidius gifuensis]|uniref:proton-coupled amino acid transporter-like protein pathetic n=1 Tax=Aphidius gifuensis TaxID=684658 RepID=UPI001CDB5FE7|nr:proton-coupled amino acid transporter-like protein pathetic [Aphidius gifuensis]